MGLFDRRDRKRRGKADDFDSPVEEVDLSQPLADEASGAAMPAGPGSAAALYVGADDDDDELLEPPTDQIDADSPIIARAASRARYGVDQAIELLKSLPDGDLEMAVLVVKRTLRSANIEIPPIIEDADQRLAFCQSRGATLTRELGELEREVAWRREELSRLERDFYEITVARERLILAERVSLTQAEQRVADARDVSEVTSSEMVSEVVNPLDHESAEIIDELGDGPTETTVDPSGSHEVAPAPEHDEPDEVTAIPGPPPQPSMSSSSVPSAPPASSRPRKPSLPPPLPSLKARARKPSTGAAANADPPPAHDPGKPAADPPER